MNLVEQAVLLNSLIHTISLGLQEQQMRFATPFVFAVIVLTTGCATYNPDHIAPSDESLLEFTEEPVREVEFSQLLEWYGYNRDYMVLRFNHQKWYALSVLEPCVSDVRQVRKLELETAISRRLGNLDRVILNGHRCLIDEIRPLDHNAFRESREATLAAMAES